MEQAFGSLKQIAREKGYDLIGEENMPLNDAYELMKYLIDGTKIDERIICEYLEETYSESNIKVGNISFPTKIKEFTSANILKVEVGTTGYMGGDSGHGGRTYFSLTDEASTDIGIVVDGKEEYEHVDKLEIVLGGDTELATFIQALEFAVKELKDRSKE